MSITEMQSERTAPRDQETGHAPAPSFQARRVLGDRIMASFPTVPSAQIDRLIDEALARTVGARVQGFRLVLAEREVRAALLVPTRCSQRWTGDRGYERQARIQSM